MENDQTLRLAVNGTELNVRVVGDGPPLMLVHGFPDSGHVWRQQIGPLVNAGFRVIVPDLRGCGQSAAPLAVDQYRIDTLIEDLKQILDELNLNEVGLIGHDWGAALCWFFLMTHPDRVSRYAALSVGHPLSYATDGFIQKLRGWYAVLFLLRRFSEWVLRVNKWAAFRAITGGHSELPVWINSLQRPGRLTAALNIYRANLITMLFKRQYPPVLRPVLGLWSSDDKFLTERQMHRSAYQATAGWTYHRIDNASHWLQIDKPEEVNCLLINYFQQKVSL